MPIHPSKWWCHCRQVKTGGRRGQRGERERERERGGRRIKGEEKEDGERGEGREEKG